MTSTPSSQASHSVIENRARNATSSPRITLTNRQLHELLRPVVPLALDDMGLPTLRAVAIQRDGNYLTAFATDRFRVGVKRVAVENLPEGNFSALVNLPELRQLLTLFKPSRRSIVKQPKLTLEVRDGTLYAEAIPNKGDEAHDLAAITVGATCLDAQYPDVLGLISNALEEDRTKGTAPTVTVNLGLLAGFREAIKWSELYGIDAVTVTTGSAPNKPIIVRIGDDFVGLIMPKRILTGDGSSEVDPKHTKEWVKQLTSCRKSPAAVSARPVKAVR